jgi:hypothetical protein
MSSFKSSQSACDCSRILVTSRLLLLRDCGSFRALGCGGDGTIGWILQEADKLGVVNVSVLLFLFQPLKIFSSVTLGIHVASTRRASIGHW